MSGICILAWQARKENPVLLFLYNFLNIPKPGIKVMLNWKYPSASGGLCPPDPLLFCFLFIRTPLLIFLDLPLDCSARVGWKSFEISIDAHALTCAEWKLRRAHARAVDMPRDNTAMKLPGSSFPRVQPALARRCWRCIRFILCLVSLEFRLVQTSIVYGWTEELVITI